MTQIKMINLTQHTATPDQLAAGVIELNAEDKAKLIKLITFDKIEDTTESELVERARQVGKLLIDYDVDAAMCGGAPFFTAILERKLKRLKVDVYYAFSERASVEEAQPDGSIKKVAVFKHKGFVKSPNMAT
jgi:hypothetical protein